MAVGKPFNKIPTGPSCEIDPLNDEVKVACRRMKTRVTFRTSTRIKWDRQHHGLTIKFNSCTVMMQRLHEVRDKCDTPNEYVVAASL